MKIVGEEFLDRTLKNFFPSEGNWKSNCFSKSKLLEEFNLPCHLRDNKWLADFIIKKYNLDYGKKDVLLDYLVNSSQFNKLRHDYEQRIVSWQIDWMCSGRENWIIDDKFGGEFYLFSSKCDYAFRKGIVDTLLAIGMDKDAIEEGIEKNASKWRERYMKGAFNNLYFVSRYNIFPKNDNILAKPSQEHYEKWMKLRLYEYYIEHKESVDKYGEVLPSMKMTESEVIELKKWLADAHEERMKLIAEYKNKIYSSNIFEMNEKDNYGCDFSSSQENENLKDETKLPRLDFKTLLYLYIKKLKIIEHMPVLEVYKKRKLDVSYCNKNEVYIFKDYDEYKNFFLMYLNNIEDDVINSSIYIKGKKGQIVALKGICEYIIVKEQVKDFYSSITQEQIGEIHSKGKLTPSEVVDLWESYDLCIEDNKTTLTNSRCNFFNHNCHDCLMEIASHKLEHDYLDFKKVNTRCSNHKEFVKKKLELK